MRVKTPSLSSRNDIQERRGGRQSTRNGLYDLKPPIEKTRRNRSRRIPRSGLPLDPNQQRTADDLLAVDARVNILVSRDGGSNNESFDSSLQSSVPSSDEASCSSSSLSSFSSEPRWKKPWWFTANGGKSASHEELSAAGVRLYGPQALGEQKFLKLVAERWSCGRNTLRGKSKSYRGGVEPLTNGNRCFQFSSRRGKLMGGLSLLVCACALFGLGSATFFMRQNAAKVDAVQNNAVDVGPDGVEEIRMPKSLLASLDSPFSPPYPPETPQTPPSVDRSFASNHRSVYRRPYTTGGFNPYDSSGNGFQGGSRPPVSHGSAVTPNVPSSSANFHSQHGPQLAMSFHNNRNSFSHRLHPAVHDVPVPFPVNGESGLGSITVNPQSVSGSLPSPAISPSSIGDSSPSESNIRQEELQLGGHQRIGLADLGDNPAESPANRERPASSSGTVDSQVGPNGNQSPSDAAEMYRQILKYVSEGNFFPDNRFNMYADAALNNLVVSILEHDNDPLVFNIFTENRVEPSTVVTILGRKKREIGDPESTSNREARQSNNNRNDSRNQLLGSGVITGLSNVTRVDDAEIRVPDPTRTLIKTRARVGPSQMTLNLNALQRRRNGIMQILIPPNRDNAEERQREIQIDIPAFPITIISAVTSSGSTLEDFEMLPIDLARLNMSFPADVSSSGNNRQRREQTLHEQCFFIVQNAFSTTGFMQERLRRYASLAVDSRIH